MDDLARWLGEQLDIDTARATAAADGDSGEWFMGDKWNVYRAEDETPNEDGETNALVVYGNVKDQSEHVAEWDPARVLQEITAKRDLLAFAKGIHDHHATFTTGVYARLEQVLRLYALAYKHRPGYRAEWAPAE